MKENLKKNNGITLVTVIVTIIVLLIIAGLIIRAAGNNNMVAQAKRAQSQANDVRNEEGGAVSSYLDLLRNGSDENYSGTRTWAERGVTNVVLDTPYSGFATVETMRYEFNNFVCHSDGSLTGYVTIYVGENVVYGPADGSISATELDRENGYYDFDTTPNKCYVSDPDGSQTWTFNGNTITIELADGPTVIIEVASQNIDAEGTWTFFTDTKNDPNHTYQVLLGSDGSVTDPGLFTVDWNTWQVAENVHWTESNGVITITADTFTFTLYSYTVNGHEFMDSNTESSNWGNDGLYMVLFKDNVFEQTINGTYTDGTSTLTFNSSTGKCIETGDNYDNTYYNYGNRIWVATKYSMTYNAATDTITYKGSTWGKVNN